MTTTIHRPAQPAIEYPDDDGEPMADNTLQFKWIVVIKDGLEALFRNHPDVFVAGNLLWYPVEGEPTIRAAPDAMVAIGRPKGRRGSYKQWEEANIAPQVVFETLSPGNRPDEMVRKFHFYEKYGVQEYYIYDPDDGSLQGWLRAGDHLEEIPEMAGFVSPRLRIRFEPGKGADNLKIVRPDGKPFLTHSDALEERDAAEESAQADRERAQADRERAQAADLRAQTAEQRAQAADLRAERLAARLRELGIEPD
jgi:Uma2 family endonuclease